jgi:hypothetical protein
VKPPPWKLESGLIFGLFTEVLVVFRLQREDTGGSGNPQT